MIAAWMLFSLVTGAALIVVGLLLESLARRAKRATRMIWLGLMFIALVMPLRSAFDTRDVAGVDRADAATTQPTPGVTDAASVVVSANAQTQSTRVVSERTSVAAQRASVAVGQWVEKASRYDDLLLRLWLALSTVCAVLVCVATMRDRRSLVVRSTDTHDAVRVRYTHNVGPAATGIFAPRILVPLWVRELAPEVRAMVMLHECEHLRSRDPLVMSIGVMAVVLAPWHLPLWTMLARLRSAIEIDCDARVLRVWPNVRGYASLLLQIAERSRTANATSEIASRAKWSARLHPLRISMASGRIAIERRIRVMTERRTRRSPTAMLGIAVVACAAGSLVMFIPAPTLSLLAQSAKARDTAANRQAAYAKPDAQIVRFSKAGEPMVIFEATPLVDERYALSVPLKYAIYELARTFYGVRRVGQPFIAIDISTTSSRGAVIEGSREGFPRDTIRMHAPVRLIYGADKEPLRLWSLNGDTLIISEPAFNSPFATMRARGTHLIILPRTDRLSAFR